MSMERQTQGDRDRGEEEGEWGVVGQGDVDLFDSSLLLLFSSLLLLSSPSSSSPSPHVLLRPSNHWIRAVHVIRTGKHCHREALRQDAIPPGCVQGEVQ